MPGVASQEPATERQLEYINDLMKSRGVELTAEIILKRSRLTKSKAGDWIARLNSMPKVQQIDVDNVGVPRASWPAIPDGRYALLDDDVVKFYRVSTGSPEGKWAGRRFLQVQAGDDLYPIRNKDTREDVFYRIAADPQGASLLYGRELGKCGVCGRTLTNPESIERGIGPVCAEGVGW